jgi:ribosome recycling factor
VQIRKHHQLSVKKGGYKKFTPELEAVRLFSLLPATSAEAFYALQFQKLLDRHIAEVDKILAAMKKTAGAK